MLEKSSRLWRALERGRAAHPQAAADITANAAFVNEETQVLPLAFEGLLDADRPLTIFDAGPAQSASVEFYNRFRCRVYFADLFAELADAPELIDPYASRATAAAGSGSTTARVAAGGGVSSASVVSVGEDIDDVPGPTPADHCVRLLDYPDDTRFDLCFFWDFLNYLDVRNLPAFAATLGRYIHADTRAHGFVAFSPRLPLLARRSAIVDLTHLQTGPETEPLPHPHARADLDDAFTAFAVSHATLLSANRLEVLLSVSG